MNLANHRPRREPRCDQRKPTKKQLNVVPFFKLDPKHWCLLPVSKLAQFFQVRNQSFSLQRKEKEIRIIFFTCFQQFGKRLASHELKSISATANISLNWCVATLSLFFDFQHAQALLIFFHEQKTSKTYPLNVIYNVNFLVLGVRSIITRADCSFALHSVGLVSQGYYTHHESCLAARHELMKENIKR